MRFSSLGWMAAGALIIVANFAAAIVFSMLGWGAGDVIALIVAVNAGAVGSLSLLMRGGNGRHNGSSNGYAPRPPWGPFPTGSDPGANGQSPKSGNGQG